MSEEEAFKAWVGNTTVLLKLNPPDPFCMRASIGGLAGKGFYCQLRYGPEGGEPGDFILLLEVVLEVLRKAEGKLPRGRSVKFKD